MRKGGKIMLDELEKQRYKRHFLLPGWDEPEQQKLKNTTVFVAGAGGTGSPTITMLALLGVGTIKICDLYEYFVKYMELGLFKIKSFNTISEKEMSFVMADMKNTVEKYDLKNDSNNPMSIFINEHFPTII